MAREAILEMANCLCQAKSLPFFFAKEKTYQPAAVFLKIVVTGYVNCGGNNTSFCKTYYSVIRKEGLDIKPIKRTIFFGRLGVPQNDSIAPSATHGAQGVPCLVWGLG